MYVEDVVDVGRDRHVMLSVVVGLLGDKLFVRGKHVISPGFERLVEVMQEIIAGISVSHETSLCRNKISVSVKCIYCRHHAGSPMLEKRVVRLLVYFACHVIHVSVVGRGEGICHVMRGN